MNRLALVSIILFAVCEVDTWASVQTIGPDGMDAAALQAMGLTGSGVLIGQVEPERPGRHGIDPPAFTHADIQPAEAYVRTVIADENELIDVHPQTVAGVMISKSMGMMPNTPRGVAPDVLLHASAANPAGGDIPPFDAFALSMQHIATLQDSKVRAINISFHVSQLPGAIEDGNNPLTLFTDWSAREHDVLYVVAGTETASPLPGLTDNFYGMTIVASHRIGGTYLTPASFNTFGHDTGSSRTLPDLMAPGDDVSVPTFFGAQATASGTSVAAPHVVGTVALLQQHAENQITADAPRWGDASHQHEVMKAVLMNSADKIEDNGTLAPEGSFLGMTRTVLYTTKFDVIEWTDSEAFSNPNMAVSNLKRNLVAAKMI